MTENNEEIQLTDGQTQDLPTLPDIPDSPQDPELLYNGSGTTTISPEADNYYSQGEFEAAFNEFLIFLKSPQTSLDAFETLRA